MKRKTLNDKYEIIDQISASSLVISYRARSIIDNSIVNLKIINPFLVSSDPDFAKRFLENSRMSFNINHPNLVRIIDSGKTEETYFLVTELIEGLSLKNYLNENGKLSIDEAKKILEQLSSALDFFHQRNLIHGCIQSTNILIESKTLRSLFIDLCIINAVNENVLNAAGVEIMSSEYISPEQAQGIQKTASSDIYSLGVVLYEILTGQLPFSGYSSSVILKKHIEEFPKPLRQIVPSIPFEVENSVLRALSKQPEDRYSSASVFYQNFLTEQTPPLETQNPDNDLNLLTVDEMKTSKLEKDSKLMPVIVIIAVFVILILAYQQFISQHNSIKPLRENIHVTEQVPDSESISPASQDNQAEQVIISDFTQEHKWLHDSCVSCHGLQNLSALIDRMKDMTRNEIEFTIQDNNHQTLNYSWDEIDEIGQFIEDWFKGEFGIDIDAPEYPYVPSFEELQEMDIFNPDRDR